MEEITAEPKFRWKIGVNKWSCTLIEHECTHTYVHYSLVYLLLSSGFPSLSIATVIQKLTGMASSPDKICSRSLIFWLGGSFHPAGLEIWIQNFVVHRIME